MTEPAIAYAPIASAARELRVLLVDDTVDIRLLLRVLLETDGRFTVVGEAGDGIEAIDAAANLQPDVVILDLSMPLMDGLEALPLIHAECPESKIVILSGFNAREMQADALNLGASSYLEKGDIANVLIPHIVALFPEHQRPGSIASHAELPEPAQQPRPTPPVASLHAEPTDEWLRMLAHELDNPVTVLQGFALMLKRAPESTPQAVIEESVAAIDRAARHLRALLEAFSDLRSIEVDALDLIREPTDLSALVRQTVTDMAEVTGPHEVHLDVVEGLTVAIDALRIRQVLMNLVTNAAKFAPADTPIDVSLRVEGDRVEAAVLDHGPGIPAGKMSELFRKFSRLNPSVEGTGIGLYLSRGIARAHGGDLVLDRSSGPGCRFVLRLPISRSGA